MVALFAKLRAIFPKKFDEQYRGNTQLDIEQLTEMSMQEWAEGLADMNGDEVKAALAYCRDELEWPPSIAEFRKAGMGAQSTEYCHMQLERKPKEPVSIDRINRVRGLVSKATSPTTKRTPENIESGAWTEEMEREFHERAKGLSIEPSNPMGLEF